MAEVKNSETGEVLKPFPWGFLIGIVIGILAAPWLVMLFIRYLDWVWWVAR